MSEKTLSVSAIKDGTVIDHIPAGQALRIIYLLKLADQNPVTVGINLTSKSSGLKDLIKVENRSLTEKEAHDVAIFAPTATINIISNYKVKKKIQATMPKVVERLLICPNTRCITHAEPIDTVFFIDEFKNKVQLRCKYCEKVFNRDEIKEGI